MRRFLPAADTHARDFNAASRVLYGFPAPG